MQTSQNNATKGINTDLDEYILPNTTLRYAQNLRLLSTSSNSYVMQNLEGNEVVFHLTKGFIPIGVTTDNTISYIFSHNPYTNEGEIGTYPSPNYNQLGVKTYVANPDIESVYPFAVYPENHYYYYTPFGEDSVPLVNEYHPLMNNQVVDGIRYNLRSTLFNFDLAHPIVSECFTKLSYDYSYNIYFTDGKNQIRVVNGSIIVSDGQATFNNRVYTPADFSTEINLTLNTLKYTKTELLSVTDGGQLKYGNYIYYIKY
jgi:hypothetical protein